MAETPPVTRLAAVLAARGMTMTELAERSGVSRFSIYRAYHAKRELQDGVWIKLANALAVSVAEIAPPHVAQRIIAVA